jgi:anti-anti-sigma regulatory factor
LRQCTRIAGSEHQKNETKEMLRIDIQSSNRVATLYCAGRLVYGVEVEMLRNLLESRIEEDLRIDLSQVTCIDGLGLLVELRNWASKTNRTLTLLDLSENVWRLVILTKLCASLDISYSDVIALDAEADECDRPQLIA